MAWQIERSWTSVVCVLSSQCVRVCWCVCEWALMWVFVFGLACVCWTILKSIKLANSSACKTWPKANTCGPRQLTQHTHTIHTHTVHTHTHTLSRTHTHPSRTVCTLKSTFIYWRLRQPMTPANDPLACSPSLFLPLSLFPSLTLMLSFSLSSSPSLCAP